MEGIRKTKLRFPGNTGFIFTSPDPEPYVFKSRNIWFRTEEHTYPLWKHRKLLEEVESSPKRFDIRLKQNRNVNLYRFFIYLLLHHKNDLYDQKIITLLSTALLFCNSLFAQSSGTDTFQLEKIRTGIIFLRRKSIINSWQQSFWNQVSM